jgi:hypothetical protein
MVVTISSSHLNEGIHELEKLVRGGTIEAVHPNTASEGTFVFHVRKEGRLLVVPFFATDRGWWARGWHFLDDGAPIYATVKEMLKEMAELSYQWGEPKTEPLEDAMHRRLGFKMTAGDQTREFWTSLSGIKGSPWSEPMSTPKGRTWIASHELGPLLWERPDPRDLGKLDGEAWPV